MGYSLCTLLVLLAPGLAASAEPAQVVQWIRTQAIPLRTVEAGNGFDDMQPIKHIVGDARIVSLGESTHGTREIFQMKHRMLEFLVTEMGFTVFAIEASLPDCTPINDYVLHGRGDPRRAVAGQGFWTWNTEEVLDLVRWMRAYNADPANAGKPRLKFYGFDMQHVPSALNGALQYFQQVDPDAMPSMRDRLKPAMAETFGRERTDLDVIRSLKQSTTELAERMDRMREAYVRASSAEDYAIARRFVTVALQGLDDQEAMAGDPAVIELFISVSGEALELLEHLRKHHPAAAERSRALLESVAAMDMFIERYNTSTEAQRAEWHQQAEQIVHLLQRSGEQQDKSPAAGDPLQQARNVVKFLEVFRDFHTGGGRSILENARDRYMAENVAWILEHEGPQARLVLWSHNFHAGVQRPRPPRGMLTMGTHLEQRFDADHLIIGFAFNRGSFQAVAAPTTRRLGLRQWTVGPAKPGSVDATLAAAGIPIFILDLRKAPDGVVRDWLRRDLPLRSIGAIFAPDTEELGYYAPVRLADAFDAIIFIDQTTSARAQRIPRFASMDPNSVALSQRPDLGALLRLPDPDDARGGLIVDEVIPGRLAHAADLRPGDRLLEIDGRAIANLADIRSALSQRHPGERVKLSIERDGKQRLIEATAPDPGLPPAP